MATRKQQSGFFTIAVAAFAAALIGSFLLANLAQAVFEKKKEALRDEEMHLKAIAEYAMSVYARNVLEIEPDIGTRPQWIANPTPLIEGAPMPASFTRNRLGVAMSPVRTYASKGTAMDRAQYYAYTRTVLYLLQDNPNALLYRPVFNDEGVLQPCGADVQAGQPCPLPSKMVELPIASWQAERLETAVRQTEAVAHLLVTYFNAQVLLDPVHEMAHNKFRDPYCATGSQKIPMGRLPCLTGFVSMYDPGGQADALIELLKRAGVTSSGFAELYYPWGTERAGRIEFANEEGPISDATGWANNGAYPYTFSVRQPLPWPAPDGSVTYVRAVAVQP